MNAYQEKNEHLELLNKLEEVNEYLDENRLPLVSQTVITKEDASLLSEKLKDGGYYGVEVRRK